MHHVGNVAMAKTVNNQLIKLYNIQARIHMRHVGNKTALGSLFHTKHLLPGVHAEPSSSPQPLCSSWHRLASYTTPVSSDTIQSSNAPQCTSSYGPYCIYTLALSDMPPIRHGYICAVHHHRHHATYHPTATSLVQSNATVGDSMQMFPPCVHMNQIIGAILAVFPLELLQVLQSRR